MRNRVILGILFLVALVLVAVFLPRADVTFGDLVEENETYSVYKIVFQGDDGKEIYGLIFKPHQEEFDVVIVLPAGGGTKDSRRWYGPLLMEMGYGSLILDQRGLGETNGRLRSLQGDFEAFLRGEDVDQYVMARDVIAAVDSLEKRRGVDEIAVLGESMGGRFGMIAGGLDSRIQGVVVLSSAGYRGSVGTEDGDRFLTFINPNTYVARISPRRLVMVHAMNDSVVPFSDAEYTFSLAREPKQLISFEGNCHGYCDEMFPFIEKELRLIFSDDRDI